MTITPQNAQPTSVTNEVPAVERVQLLGIGDANSACGSLQADLAPPINGVYDTLKTTEHYFSLIGADGFKLISIQKLENTGKTDDALAELGVVLIQQDSTAQVHGFFLRDQGLFIAKNVQLEFVKWDREHKTFAAKLNMAFSLNGTMHKLANGHIDITY